MTSFSDFIQKVFKIGKKKSEQLDFDASHSIYETTLKWAIKHQQTALICISIMQYLPNINSHVNINKEDLKGLLPSLVTVRRLYLKSRKESDEVLFWLNQYMKECSNGKAS